VCLDEGNAMKSERAISTNHRRAAHAGLLATAVVAAVGLAAVAVVAAPVGGPEKAKAEGGGANQLSLSLPASGVLRVLNAGGRIVVSTWDGEDVLLTITKEVMFRSRESLPWFRLGGAPRLDERTRAVVDAIKPRVRQGQDGVEVSTLTHSPTEDVVLNYNYEVRLPRGRALAVSNGSGPVHVTGVEGAVDVATGNGDIECEVVLGDVMARAENGAMRFSHVDGALQARTANGAIVVDNDMLDAPRSVNCRTDNGPIRLRAPHDAAYAVNATTMNGRVDADHINGDTDATLFTLNGSIVVEGN
jgi:hypothetical protein